MKKTVALSLVGLSLLGGTNLAEEPAKGRPVSTDLKIRVVDSFTLMRETEEGKETAQALQEKYKELAEKLQDLNKKLEMAASEYKNKEAMLSDVAKEAEQKKLMRMKREIEVLAQESEEEYKLAAQKATERISKEIIDAVSEIAKAENLDVIFDKDSGRALFVADGKANYTDKVKLGMNKKHETKKKTA